MPVQTYTIEVKADVPDDAQHAALVAVMIEAARGFFAAATLVAGGSRSQPRVMCRTQDNFFSEEEIDPLREERDAS